MISEPLRSPYDRRMIFFVPKLSLRSCSDCTVIAGSSYGARTTCLRSKILGFLKNCNSADYYKVVQATELVGSCKILGTSLGHHAETVQKCKSGNRSLQANRRPNVT